ncbi:hypothetical protein ACF0H5_017647 [Mactra antiquata]
MIVMYLSTLLCLVLTFVGCVSGLTKHWSTWIRTDETYFTFEHIITVSIKSCLEACIYTKACQYANFDIRAKLCNLVRTNGTVLSGSTLPTNVERQPGYVLGVKTELIQESPVCEFCPDKGSCDVGSCRSSGCENPPQFNHSFYRSSAYAYNSKIRYFCNHNYTTFTHDNTNVSISVCQQDGTWSDVTFKCIPDTAECRDATCYYVYDELTNWFQAIENCEKTNGHPVDVNDENEQQFIESHYSNYGSLEMRLWTGGNSLQSSETFRWYDSSIFSYTNWNEHQPNLLDSQRCVALVRNLTWNNLECSLLNRVLCETSII